MGTAGPPTLATSLRRRRMAGHCHLDAGNAGDSPQLGTERHTDVDWCLVKLGAGHCDSSVQDISGHSAHPPAVYPVAAHSVQASRASGFLDCCRHCRTEPPGHCRLPPNRCLATLGAGLGPDVEGRTICCHSSTGASRIGPSNITPALLTRMSRAPYSATAAARIPLDAPVTSATLPVKPELASMGEAYVCGIRLPSTRILAVG